MCADYRKIDLNDILFYLADLSAWNVKNFPHFQILARFAKICFCSSFHLNLYRHKKYERYGG